MHDPDKESVAQGVNYIITALEIIARLAQDPKTCDEVAEEEGALWTVKNHIEWICSYIKEKRDEEIKARDAWLKHYGKTQDRKTKLRTVQ